MRSVWGMGFQLIQHSTIKHLIFTWNQYIHTVMIFDAVYRSNKIITLRKIRENFVITHGRNLFAKYIGWTCRRRLFLFYWTNYFLHLYFKVVCFVCVCISFFENDFIVGIKIRNNGAVTGVSLDTPPVNFGFCSIFTPFLISEESRTENMNGKNYREKLKKNYRYPWCSSNCPPRVDFTILATMIIPIIIIWRYTTTQVKKKWLNDINW